MEKFIRNEDNLASKIHNEIVMVNITQGNYFGLNSVGSDIWELLNQPRSIDEICGLLIEEYSIDMETCKNHVTGFLEELIKQGLIHKV